MPDAFISYSRQDADFVRRLAAELTDRGKDVWVDEKGIRDGEVFPEALRRAIEASDAFVFVISPASVSSEYCEQEVAHAAGLNKRIVPLALHPVPGAELPDEIRVRTWIPVGEDTAAERVIAAIEADLEWEREHTRLTVKALEWDQSGRDRSFLVRGSDLHAAERWLAAGAGKDGGPTALEQTYLLAARRAASRRQRTLVGVSAGVTVVALALLAFALISRGQAVRAQGVAKSRALAAESETEVSADPELSILLAIEAVRTSATPQAMYALREAIDQSPLRRQLPGRGNQYCTELGYDEGAPAIAYSPSGGQLAEVTCDGNMRVFDDATGHFRARFKIGTPADAVAFSPGGRTVAVAAEGGITLMDAATGKVLRSLSPRSNKSVCVGLSCPNINLPSFAGYCVPGPLNALGTIPAEVAFSPGGARLAVSYGFNLDIWPLTASGPPRVVGGARDCVEGVGFSPSGAEILIADNADVDVIDAASGRLLGVRPVVVGRRVAGQGYPAVGRLAVSPNGRYVATAIGLDARGSGEVEVFDAAPWRRLATIAYSTDAPITALAFSPDSSRLAIGTGDGTAGIWSVASAQELLALSGQTADVTSIVWRPDGGEIATASEDGALLLWSTSLTEGTSIATGGGPTLTAANVRGERVWAAFATPFPGTDALRSWTRTGAAGEPIAVPAPQTGAVAGLSQNGRVGMLVDSTLNIVIRELANGRLIGKVSQGVPVTDLSLAADRLAVGSNPGLESAGGFAALYEIAPGMPQIAQTYVPGASCGASAYVTISADGQRAAAVGYCGGGVLWNARSGAQLETFDTGVASVSRVSLSPDGRLLAISSLARTTTIFDLATKRPLHVLTGDTGPVTGVAFSPRGSWIATASDDGDVRIWAAGTGELMRVLPEGASVTSVAFTADGEEVVSTDSAGRIHIQDACSLCGDASGLLRLAASRVTRSLTPAERATYGV